MSQLNVNALRQPDAAPLNGVSLSGQQIGAPAGLGNNHSVGRTIGRVIAAIFTLGISEAVRAIIRAVKAESAPAVPHLPQNRQLSPWERMREANKDLAARLSSDALPSVERGKNKALTALGTFGTMNTDAFQERLEDAVCMSHAQVDDAALEKLAEKTARAMLMESIVKTALKDAPEGATVSTDSLVTPVLLTDQARRLADAPTAETAEVLVATIKDVASERVRSSVALEAVKKELFSTGLEFFRKTTGLNEEQTASFNTWNLENKMNMTQGDIDKKFATPERPYAKAGRDALLNGFRPEANLFFADRAAAYNSIAKLDVPDSLKTSWRKKCLVANERISGDTFSNADAGGRAIANFSQWNSLMDPKLTVDEKLKLLGDIAANIQSLLEESFGAARVAKMGKDEKVFIVALMYDVVGTVKPELVASLQTSPAVGALMTELEERTDQAMLMAGTAQLNGLVELKEPLQFIQELQKPQE